MRYVLNGVKNFAPGSSRRPPRPPVNSDMLVRLVNALDLSSPSDAAVAACAVTAFWGQCRLGELLPPYPLSLPPSPLPLRSDFKRSLKNPHACILRLPRTKTHHHGQDVVLVHQCPPINPISLLKNHIWANSVRHDDVLFSFISTSGRVILSKKFFLRRCNAIWSTLGFPRTTGHCFRIGGTTELLVAGIPPDIVKAMGRWSSESIGARWTTLRQAIFGIFVFSVVGASAVRNVDLFCGLPMVCHCPGGRLLWVSHWLPIGPSPWSFADSHPFGLPHSFPQHHASTYVLRPNFIL